MNNHLSNTIRPVYNSRVALLEKRVKVWKWTAYIFGACLLGVALGALNTHYSNKAYDNGYEDGYSMGINEGWSDCIEENNLYDRYSI